MTDVDRARAALTDELNILAGVYHVGRGQLEAVRAAADRLALAYLNAAAAECINCQDADPEEREELTQQTGHGWCDAHRALRARLEGGSHAD